MLESSKWSVSKVGTSTEPDEPLPLPLPSPLIQHQPLQLLRMILQPLLHNPRHWARRQLGTPMRFLLESLTVFVQLLQVLVTSFRAIRVLVGRGMEGTRWFNRLD